MAVQLKMPHTVVMVVQARAAHNALSLRFVFSTNPQYCCGYPTGAQQPTLNPKLN